jgi:hypothetical protein
VGSFTRRGTFDLVSRARCRFTGLVIVTCFPKKGVCLNFFFFGLI